MKKKHSSHRYQQLVAAFATSAFALLGILAMQQHDANVTTASVARNARVMSTYQSNNTCVLTKAKRVVTVRNQRECTRLQSK